MRIFTVHGTYASGWLIRSVLAKPAWWYPDSAFCRALSAGLPNCLISKFKWNGRNSHSARTAAGEELARVIQESRSPGPEEQICLVGHSHGGNVALKAIDVLPKDTVSSLFLLGVPQMGLRCGAPSSCDRFFEATEHPCGGSTEHYSYWGDAANRVRTGIWNFYCNNDAVQVFLAGAHTGFPLLRRLRLPGSIMLAREFLPPKASNVTNIRLELNTRERMGFFCRLVHWDAIMDHDALTSCVVADRIVEVLRESTKQSRPTQTAENGTNAKQETQGNP